VVRYAIIVVLLVVVGVLADRLVREENQRYAFALGMCSDGLTGKNPSVGFLDYGCLDKVQTRTGWMWHLWYGVTEPLPQVPWTSND
jgi:hypothetical protein